MNAGKVLAEVYDCFEVAEDKDGEYLRVTGITDVHYKEVDEIDYALVACKKTGKIFKLTCVEVDGSELSEDEKTSYVNAMKYASEDINGPWRNY